jgi:hypothetical protein
MIRCCRVVQTHLAFAVLQHCTPSATQLPIPTQQLNRLTQNLSAYVTSSCVLLVSSS